MSSLCNRQQRVETSGISHSRKHVIDGVSEGFLDPLLFVLIINDSPSVRKKNILFLLI